MEIRRINNNASTKKNSTSFGMKFYGKYGFLSYMDFDKFVVKHNLESKMFDIFKKADEKLPGEQYFINAGGIYSGLRIFKKSSGLNPAFNLDPKTTPLLGAFKFELPRKGVSQWMKTFENQINELIEQSQKSEHLSEHSKALGTALGS